MNDFHKDVSEEDRKLGNACGIAGYMMLGACALATIVLIVVFLTQYA